MKILSWEFADFLDEYQKTHPGNWYKGIYYIPIQGKKEISEIINKFSIETNIHLVKENIKRNGNHTCEINGMKHKFYLAHA